MAEYRWNGGNGGSFANASSWIDSQTGTADSFAPGVQDSVDLSGSGAITGSGSVAAMDELAGSVFSLSATITAAEMSDYGRLTLSGGRLQAGTMDVDGGGALLTSAGAYVGATGLMLIGESSQGTMFLNGSTLSTQGGMMLGGGAGSAQGLLELVGSSWSDAGAVTIGNVGQGVLTMNSSPAGFAAASIGGNFDLGGSSGTGTATFSSSEIMVAGLTVIGSSSGYGAPSALTVQAGSQWTSQGVVIAYDASGGAPNLLSVTGTGTSFTAGLLSVGQNGLASIASGASAKFGNGPASSALNLAGTFSLTGNARLAVAGHASLVSNNSASLSISGATASIAAAGGPAFVVGSQAQASIAGSGLLTVSGGVALAGGTLLVSTGGALSSTGAGQPSVLLSDGAALSVQNGALNTVGLFEIVHGAVHGGTLTTAGATLTSRAYASPTVAPSSLAVSIGAAAAAGPQNGIDGAQLVDSTWSIAGALGVGLGGQGTLTAQGSRIAITGYLQVGGGGSAAGVTLSPSDTVVSGGTLAAGITGLSAQAIAITGAGAHLSAGVLQIANMTINAGQATALGPATVLGTLSLLAGGQLNAGSVTIHPGAAVLGAGRITSNTIVDLGRIGVTGGTLVLAGAVSGNGALGVRAGTLDLVQGEAAGVGVAFGNAGTIVTPSVADLAGTISGWQLGDLIDFTGQQITSFSYSAGTLSLFDGLHGLFGKETFAGSLTSANFTLTGDRMGGTFLAFHE